MSFSSTTKSGLCDIINNSCCNMAELYGFALFAGTFNSEELKLVTENVKAASRFVKLFDECLDIKAFIKTNDKGVYVCGVEQGDCRLVFEAFSQNKTSVRINRANIENECCYASFLRGVFLAAGSVTDPSKEYHLEITVNFLKLSQDLMQFLSESELEPKRNIRRGKYVLYFTESEKIEDFLTLIGATNAALEIMNVKIYKDVKNHAVRATNCDSANLEKTIKASEEQIKAIKIIKDYNRFSELPERLQEIARVREKNPEFSIMQIAEELSISKSGANHRIKKLMEIAESLNGGHL